MPKGKIEATAEQWRERVRRWKESGLTAAEFAAQEGISKPKALSRWAYHLSQRDKPKGEASTPVVRLVPLKPIRSPQRNASVEQIIAGIEVRCGKHSVIVPAGFDSETLRRLLTILEVE